MLKSRFAAAAVSVAAGLLVVSACGSSSKAPASEANLAFNQLPPCPIDAFDKAPKPVKITIWSDAQVEGLTAMNELVKRFNSSQKDVEVTLDRVYGDAVTGGKLRRAYLMANGLMNPADAPAEDRLPSGTLPPALVQLDNYQLREMSDSGAVLPAQSCINATKFDTSGMNPAVKAYYSIGGVQWPSYAIPSVAMMEYNADLFKKAGLDPTKPPTTLAELHDVAQKLKKSGVQIPIAMPTDTNLIESWLTGAGATLVSESNGRASAPQRATFYTQAAVDVFTELRKMVQEGLLKISDNSNGNIDHLLALATGSSAITFETSSSTTSIAAVVGGDQNAIEQSQQINGGSSLGGTITTDYRAAPLPGLTSKGTGQVSVSGKAWFISRGVAPEQQVAAWKFSQFMYEPASQITVLTKFGGLPMTPALSKDAQVVKFFTKGGMAGRWLNVANSELGSLNPDLPGPLIGPYDDFVSILGQAMLQVQSSPQLTPSQILTNAENSFTQKLANYNTTHG